MKLFKFYPNEFCRMYVIGNSLEEVQSRVDELFIMYMKTSYDWLDVDDPDEFEYIEEKREEFLRGLLKAREMSNGIAVDSHY
jgi:hypothetical protein